MAKPRKAKNEDRKVDTSGSVVQHQKLCLSIDMDTHRIYGFTELEIAVADSGIVGLYADDLEIESVLVDGEPAEFEVFPHFQLVELENRWCSVSSVSSAADAAGSTYISALEREIFPNLFIMCCMPKKTSSHQLGELNSENGIQSYDEPKQNVKSVRINYWVEKAETGIHFENNVLFTDNQMRRSRCWFPCMDESSQRCCFDLEFTVSHGLVAVSTGNLLYQVLNKEVPLRKTFVYRLDVPVTAQWISLAVAPFEILGDRHSSLSHMCLPANLSKMRNTVGFLHGAFSHYEDYLSASFPFGSYKQVFIAPEMAISSLSFGASMGVFSSQVLFDEKVIDQTIETRIKLAHALARQWFGVYISPEAPNDEWLLDGLAGFLADSFVKRFLGNNEARYRRYKANCAVCKADDCGATALSSSAPYKDLYGTQSIGLYGKIRSWKAVAVLQMLEKQMGPESFRKILQTIVSRAQDTTRSLRTLSTKEFRHFSNKVGNLERPFLKEFFPRWVRSCGCPVLRMGLSYNKRKNMVELAVLRGCTATTDLSASVVDVNPDSENRDGDVGWPGMMSIRVHELDGMYDHPILPVAGDSWQLLEIQCHSKLAARRFLKSKRGSKPDGSDDNGDAATTLDPRANTESPLLWLRADPEMEYLAEIHFNQPVQMWINQLEKDKDVVAQAQAIAKLEALPHLSFSVVNALNTFLSDSKAFWRVRIEAAFALATTASEETDWAGLLHLIKFYKNRRFDMSIGLPKPNDFHDFPEYFVLEAIPHAIAMVRAADKKSPREAVEFVLQLLKYNDNNGNPYSDAFWLTALVQSIGELEFGQQSILLLSSLLKRIDRLLQFDRLMPSYNGILTISCIRTLTQIASKLSGFIPLDRISKLIEPFQDLKMMWQIRVEASRALLDLEFHCRGINGALLLFVKYLKEEPSLRGQAKLGVHAMWLCQTRGVCESNGVIESQTLVALLRLLESRMAFNNVFLRHYLFCILQILAGRRPTLHGVARDQVVQMGSMDTCSEFKNNLVAILNHAKPLERPADVSNNSHEGLAIAETSKEAETVSNSQERRMPVVKIRVKQSAASSRAEESNHMAVEKFQCGANETDRGASSSISVDAPQKNFAEAGSLSNQILEDVNSCHDRGSRMTASIGSVKHASDCDEFRKELQCTADSSRVAAMPRLLPPSNDQSSPSFIKDNNVDADAQKFASLQVLSAAVSQDLNGSSVASADREQGKGEIKKDKEKKRKREDYKGHRDDPAYLERRRLKKERKLEKKRKEKEMAKLLHDGVKSSPLQFLKQKDGAVVRPTIAHSKTESSASKLVVKMNQNQKTEALEGTSAPKFRIKIKNRAHKN